MYHVPSLYNSRNWIIPVPDMEVQACRDECVFRSVCPFDDDVLQLCNLLMNENNWNVPNSVLECAELYLKLREHIRSLL